MRKQSAIRELLTDAEINQCLQRAFDALPQEDQENIQAVIDRFDDVRNFGPKSGLNLLFVVDQAPALAELNRTLENQEKGG